MGLRPAVAALLAAVAIAGCALFRPVSVVGPGEPASALGVTAVAWPNGRGGVEVTFRNGGRGWATVWLTPWAPSLPKDGRLRSVVLGYEERVVCDGAVCRVEKVPITKMVAQAWETAAVLRLDRYRVRIGEGAEETCVLRLANLTPATGPVAATLGCSVRAGGRVESVWLVVPVSLAGEPSVP